MRKYKNRNNFGFTMIELIMVITIIGILGFTAIQKFSTADISEEAAADQVEAYIRYCQIKAMSQHSQESVDISSDAEGWYFTILDENHYIPDNLSFSYPSTIIFNSLGEAIVDGSVDIGSITISVEPITGVIER